MKKIPIFLQLIFGLLLVFIIPVSVIGYYNNRNLMQYSQEEIANLAVGQLNSNARLAETLIGTVINSSLQLAEEEKIDNLKNLQLYQVMNSTDDSINFANDILENIKDIAQAADELVYSIVFYLDNSDYVISTNRGIIQLQDYESMDWLSLAVEKMQSSQAIFYPRILTTVSGSENINVVSYVYRLNTAKGTVIINFRSDKISEILEFNSDNDSNMGYLLQSDGTVISNGINPTQFMWNYADIFYVKDILDSGDATGYAQITLNKEELVYTYSKNSNYNWVYVKTYKLKNLLEKTNFAWGSFFALTVTIAAVGASVIIFEILKFSKQGQSLADNVKKMNGLEDLSSKNEMEFLNNTFDKIKAQEEEVHKILKQKEREVINQRLRRALNEELSNPEDIRELGKLFPYNNYIVSLVSMDNAKIYMEATDRDTRRFHRYTLYSKIKELFPDDYRIECTKNGMATIAVITNICNYDHMSVSSTLYNIFTAIKHEIKRDFGYTATVGISNVHDGLSCIKECNYEAAEAVRRRMFLGVNSIIFYSETKSQAEYKSFYDNEKKIINYISKGDFANVEKILEEIIRDIRSAQSLSNDNLLLILNQLVGSTMEFMLKNNINTGKILKHSQNIYLTIANMDTLEEIQQYLLDVYSALCDCIKIDLNGEEGVDYTDKILKYIQNHYKEDILFEEIAQRIGISYSYLRKIVKEETGKSLIDNVNILRINEAKRLLRETDMTLSQIAEEVGYHNIQSITRFFKKYEGILPSEYRNINK